MFHFFFSLSGNIFSCLYHLVFFPLFLFFKPYSSHMPSYLSPPPPPSSFMYTSSSNLLALVYNRTLSLLFGLLVLAALNVVALPRLSILFAGACTCFHLFRCVCVRVRVLSLHICTSAHMTARIGPSTGFESPTFFLFPNTTISCSPCFLALVLFRRIM